MSRRNGIEERKPSIAHDFFSLEAVDFGELKEEVRGLTHTPSILCLRDLYLHVAGVRKSHRGGPPHYGGYSACAAAEIRWCPRRG